MVSRTRLLVLAIVGVLIAVLAGYAVPRLRADGTSADGTSADGAPSVGPAGAITLSESEIAELAQRSLRAPLTRERFYFVMADRFANGDPSNDDGGLTGDRLVTGLDPSDKGFFHGGDLAGLAGKLDYIKGMGATALWLTPSFTNRVVQGPSGAESAGYHGYWITDFTTIDPHLGTNAELAGLVKAAHAKGMKVFLDIVTNHTADVIDYEGGEHAYVARSDQPYRGADGATFDDAEVAGSADFPKLAADTSFPYVPVWRVAADAEAKTPAWLNDPTMYHNRGDSTFSGESSTYGDFAGLDDLFTENPTVVDGMIDIYNAWVDVGVDGFRVDTVKHVNMEFWQRFAPAVLEHARATGNDRFFLFGEVYDTSAAAMSAYTTTGRLPATLDFGFQSAAIDFVSGSGAQRLHDLFAGDDLYLDTDSNAYALPTFLGNHDMGRVGSFLVGASDDDADLLARDKLAMSLMYLTRGQPVTYYGDEQGLMGWGGDKDARQDLFATKVEQYATERVLGGPSGALDRFDTSHVLYEHLAALARLRDEHPALADGAQIERFVGTGEHEGVYAFSRIDPTTKTEYLVAVNNGAADTTVTVPTATPATSFTAVLVGPTATSAETSAAPSGATPAATPASAADGKLIVTVPRRGVIVLRASAPIPAAASAPTVALTIGSGTPIIDSVRLAAQVSGGPADVTFAVRARGSRAWIVVGTDDNPDYAAYGSVAGMPPGGTLEVVAVARTLDGTTGYAAGSAPIAVPAAGGDGSLITAPGTYQALVGCATDWDPACTATALTDSDGDGTFTLRLSTLPAGDYELKVAVGGTWDENYGVDGVADGANIAFTVGADNAPVTIAYDSATHLVSVASARP